MTSDQIIKKFSAFTTANTGIESLFSPKSDPLILERLCRIDSEPLTKVQFNQLLGLAHEMAVSDDFFNYYWTSTPPAAYELTTIPGYNVFFSTSEKIMSLDHLMWGLSRIYFDALLFKGNVRAFFRKHAPMDASELLAIPNSARFDTEGIKRRGPSLPFAAIPKDDRYLISEMACKSYGDDPASQSQLKTALFESFHDFKKSGGGAVKIKDLLGGAFAKNNYANEHQMFLLSADDILESEVTSVGDLEEKYAGVVKQFLRARQAALENTKKFLSLVHDLDIYVATSMRTRADFRRMADDCEKIFRHPKLAPLHLRYFDPTMSAAEGHQDKGLIECLMVKCAKILVYCAGEKESYGKDAEASMALSLGKPVIFFCEHPDRKRFYRDVHPLSRLINFATGVAVGAIVTDNVEQVVELLWRTNNNTMEYVLEQPKPSYLVLKEKLTDSVVRLQTNDRLLTESFWNHYRTR